MRRFTYSDLISVARTIYGIPKDRRASTLNRLFETTSKGAVYWANIGRPHPEFGDGTLQSAVSGFPKNDQLDFSDRQFRDCIIQILQFANRNDV